MRGGLDNIDDKGCDVVVKLRLHRCVSLGREP
jgi:hypothetical protein